MAPGVVGGDVEVLLVLILALEIVAQHPRRHPGVVALAEHAQVAVLAGGIVGIGERAEVEQVVLARLLAGGDGDAAGRAAEQHGRAFGGELIHIAPGALRLGGGIPFDQVQRPAAHAAGGVDFINGHQGAALLHQPLFTVFAGVRVVKAQLHRCGRVRDARQQAGGNDNQAFFESHGGSPELLLCACGRGDSGPAGLLRDN